MVLQRRYGGGAVAMVGAFNGLRPPYGAAGRRGQVSTRARQTRRVCGGDRVSGWIGRCCMMDWGPGLHVECMDV